VIAEDAVKSFELRGPSRRGFRDDFHSVGSGRSTRPDQLSINFDHAGIAGLDRSKFGVVTDMRQRYFAAVDGLDHKFPGRNGLQSAIDEDRGAGRHGGWTLR
jgi:hypothetical protein